MLPGTVVLLLAFFAILHSWLNAFAELLCFADRQFYKDWWNARSFAAYYRTWNCVVHDWLYSYIYCELIQLRYSKLFSMMCVFVVSAVLHEWVIMCMLHFFYPVLLLMFGGVGVYFVFLTRNQTGRVWNVFMWLMLFFGTGLLMCLYSVEYFARKNLCPDCRPFHDLVPISYRLVEWKWE
eukprot:m.62960 g.62960  ORF g.62960 m.62960 type:complete len:180 (-) comp49604_c0_seq8:102-641(-)